MRISRRPAPALRPFVETLWAIDEREAESSGLGARSERVLPTGATHLVFRLTDTPLRVFDDLTGRTPPRAVGCAVLGGARSTFYLRDVSIPVWSVGAQLRPGAVPFFFGVRADALAGRHTPLEDLCGRETGDVRSRIAKAGSLEAQIAVLESFLASRLPRVRGVHPAVADALEHFEEDAHVELAVARSRYSERHFIQLFRGAVGLGPKAFSRVRRFQRALRHLAAGESLAHAALVSGYSDQSHLNREFRALAGMAPRAYLRATPGGGNHVAASVALPASLPRAASESPASAATSPPASSPRRGNALPPQATSQAAQGSEPSQTSERRERRKRIARS